MSVSATFQFFLRGYGSNSSVGYCGWDCLDILTYCKYHENVRNIILYLGDMKRKTYVVCYRFRAQTFLPHPDRCTIYYILVGFLIFL